MEKKFPELYGDSQVVCIHCLLKLLIRTPIFTCLLLLRITYRIMRMLMPIPQQPGQISRYRRQPTGLPIPAMEVLLFVFGTVCLVAYVW